eukprot:gnl/Chilomastix_caulleri/5182.p1 GENE.gnl/Chilomastix_caulleri/5182~~gnl/Chilomastix_caulleri/5182.p1  ORF type:complete len:55 (-),score=8.82 gnl/Chilomastix_caulleri/5182:52-216(-)
MLFGPRRFPAGENLALKKNLVYLLRIIALPVFERAFSSLSTLGVFDFTFSGLLC